jgi:hypothetical protein
MDLQLQNNIEFSLEEDKDAYSAILEILSKCKPHEKNDIFELLEGFARHSKGKKRDNSLYLLALESKDASNRLLDDLINEIGDEFSEKKNLIYPAIIMIDNCCRKDKLQFCTQIFEWSITNNNREFASLVIKCILVLGWKEHLLEISKYFEWEDDDGFLIHSIAVFICEKGPDEFKILERYLPIELRERIKRRMPEIRDILENRYMRIKRSEQKKTPVLRKNSSDSQSQ